MNLGVRKDVHLMYIAWLISVLLSSAITPLVASYAVPRFRPHVTQTIHADIMLLWVKPNAKAAGQHQSTCQEFSATRCFRHVFLRMICGSQYVPVPWLLFLLWLRIHLQWLSLCQVDLTDPKLRTHVEQRWHVVILQFGVSFPTKIKSGISSFVFSASIFLPTFLMDTAAIYLVLFADNEDISVRFYWVTIRVLELYGWPHVSAASLTVNHNLHFSELRSPLLYLCSACRPNESSGSVVYVSIFFCNTMAYFPVQPGSFACLLTAPFMFGWLKTFMVSSAALYSFRRPHF